MTPMTECCAACGEPGHSYATTEPPWENLPSPVTCINALRARAEKAERERDELRDIVTDPQGQGAATAMPGERYGSIRAWAVRALESDAKQQTGNVIMLAQDILSILADLGAANDRHDSLFRVLEAARAENDKVLGNSLNYAPLRIEADALRAAIAEHERKGAG